MQFDNDPDEERQQRGAPPEGPPGGAGRPNPYAVPSQDPDALRDLVQQARKVPLSVQRITSTEIKALKVTGERQQAVKASLGRMIAGFFSGIIAGIGGLFAGPVKKKFTTCEQVGHVVPKTWGGEFPRCEDCGAIVDSPDQLRSASRGKQ